VYLLTVIRAGFRRPTRSAIPLAWVKVAEPFAVAAYLVTLTVAVGQMATLRLLWFDELFTLHLARFGSPLELWRNLAAGADNNPPVIYLLTAVATAWLGETHFALRLPALIGAVLTGLCLYLFVRRRRGAAEALLALTAVGVTAPVWVYYLEARPYGLMMGLTALALLCWQRASDPQTRRTAWVVGFAVAVVLGIGTHYYFVVPIAGLAIAEAVRSLARRQLDRPLLAGFVAAGLTLAALYPLWGAAPKNYAPGFWAKAKFNRASVEEAFHGLAAKDLTLPLVLALAAGMLAGAVGSHSPSHLAPPQGEENYPAWEAVALVALAAGPVLGVLIGAKLVGGYHFRYTVPAAIGLAGLFAFAIGRTAAPAKWVSLLAAAVCAVTGAAGQWKAAPQHFRAEADAHWATTAFLDTHTTGGLVVVESPFEFTRLWHYHGDRRYEPVFLADPAAALQYTKVDTIDRGLLALSRAVPAPVVGFDDVLQRLTAGKPTYYFGPRVPTTEEAADQVDARGLRARWLPWLLANHGVQFEPMAQRANGTLYRLKR
jgi:hypothetical protein